MSHRLKLIVAYDGGAFEGWQSQRSGNTVQDRLEKAFKGVTGESIRIHGAGRTDAGVHALGQCCHIDVARKLPTSKWIAAVNSHLPPTVRVLRCRYVGNLFHARYSARSKLYRYRIWNAATLPPFEYGRSWHIAGPLDFARLHRAARLFEGKHDFRGFAAGRGKPAKETVRTIFKVRMRRHGPEVFLEFEGDGFLYKMVRLMVGDAVHCAQGKQTFADIARRLKKPFSHARFVAPAAGLILVRVRY